jgi:hypothetical protein
VLISYTKACVPDKGLQDDLVGVFTPEVDEVYVVARELFIFKLDQNVLLSKNISFISPRV